MATNDSSSEEHDWLHSLATLLQVFALSFIMFAIELICAMLEVLFIFMLLTFEISESALVVLIFCNMIKTQQIQLIITKRLEEDIRNITGNVVEQVSGISPRKTQAEMV